MSINQLLLYCFVIFSVSIVPGPSMILAFREGATYHTVGTIPAALGNMTASLMQALVAFFAFHSIIILTPQAQSVIQIIGAGFICYIGYIFIKSGRDMRIESVKDKVISRPWYKRFVEGFLIALFNPKAILFFIALFPQFTDEMQMGSLIDLMQIFVPIGLVAFLCFMSYGVLGQSSSILFDDEKVFGVAIPVLGGLMIAIAIFVTIRYFMLCLGRVYRNLIICSSKESF